MNIYLKSVCLLTVIIWVYNRKQQSCPLRIKVCLTNVKKYMEENIQKPTIAQEVYLKPQTEESFSKKLGLFLVDFLQTFLIAAAIFIFVYHFLCQPNQILGASMEPNFNNGEYILTDKITYRLRQPKRGDVIVFQYPGNLKTDFFKRIIAEPGESILIHNGRVYVFNEENPNGVELKEYYIPDDFYTSGGSRFPTDIKTLVPLDSYFVLGDNREKSSDSRAWGTVPREDIIGRAIFRYWPPSKIGIVK